MYRSRFSSVFVLLISILFSPSAIADERNPGDIEVNVWGLSKHIESPPKGHKWNEINSGIGLRRYFQSPIEVKSLETFITADSVIHNSTGGRLISGGVGAQYPVTSIGDAKILVGGAAGIFSYENRFTRKTHTGLGGYPFLALRYSDVITMTMTVGYIPKIRMNGLETYPAVFLFISVPIR